MERYCVNCREEFDPIEGNETREFCSDSCDPDYDPPDYDAGEIDMENAKAYDEGYGRKCTKP